MAENNPALLAAMPDGCQRLKAVRVDCGGVKPLKPFKLSMPAPADIPQGAQFFIAKEVFVLGEKRLMAVDTMVLKDGRLEVNSPPWPALA